MFAKKSISINRVLLTLLALSLVGCSGEKGKAIRQNEYGVDWPFTVAEGQLSCVWFSKRRQIVTFIAPNGTEYALNGNARESGFFQSVEPIHKPDSSSSRLYMNLNPVIANVLKLCP